MNNFPSRETVQRVRNTYPAGCRVVIDQMDDRQAPPIGTQGTVIGVDDIASVMVAWDNGCGLSVCYGEDRCHKIAGEEEAKETLEWYAKHQKEENARCPRCGERMAGPTARHALSRRLNIYICDEDGMREALEDAGFLEKLPLMKWAAISEPQNGGRAWKE